MEFGFHKDKSIVVEEDPNKEYESINSVNVCRSIFLFLCVLYFGYDKMTMSYTIKTIDILPY